MTEDQARAPQYQDLDHPGEEWVSWAVEPPLPIQVGVMPAAAALAVLAQAAARIVAPNQPERVLASRKPLPNTALAGEVVATLQAGAHPAECVTRLVRDALTVGQGRAPDLAALEARINRAREAVARLEPSDDRAEEAATHWAWLTLLNPQHPAVDLWHKLEGGLENAWAEFTRPLTARQTYRPRHTEPQARERQDEWERRLRTEFDQLVAHLGH